MVDILLTIVIFLGVIGVILMMTGFQVFLYHEAWVDKWACKSHDKWLFWIILPWTIATWLISIAFIIDGFQQGAF